MVTMKPMVCESPDKGLVVQGEDLSPHLTDFSNGHTS
jgi:hypothetical protein